MKARFIFLIILLTIGNALAQDIQFRKTSDSYYANGQLKKCHLLHETQINGFLCKRWIRFYENGAVKQIQVAEDCSVQNLPTPKDTFVFFREDSMVEKMWLSRDTEIQGILCHGGWGKSATGFYASGRLRFTFPPQRQMINEIPCKPGGLAGVYFHENGQLQRCYLDTDIVYQGKEYKKDTRLTFDESGTVVSTYRKTFWEKWFPMFN